MLIFIVLYKVSHLLSSTQYILLTVLWDLSKDSIDKFYTQWRTCIRKLLCVPYTTHCDMLHLLVQDKPIECQLILRAVKFYQAIIKSDNTIVQVCGQLALNGSRSKVSNSINYIAYKCSLSKYDIMYHKKIGELKCILETTECEDNCIRCGNVLDLFLKQEQKGFFTESEIKYMIDFLCTT